jgi:hypothetical protein
MGNFLLLTIKQEFRAKEPGNWETAQADCPAEYLTACKA